MFKELKVKKKGTPAEQNAQQENVKIERVAFYSDEILAIYEDGQIWVAVRPIIENLGLNWSKQYRKILADPVLSQVVAQKATTSKGEDGKTYTVKMLCLPVEYLNGFLFKINPNKVKSEETREKIIRYQKECYRVLYEYFFEGYAINKRFFEDVEAIKKELEETKRTLSLMEYYMWELWYRKRGTSRPKIPKKEPLSNLRKYNPNWVYIRQDIQLWLCKKIPIPEIQRRLFANWNIFVSESALRRYKLWWENYVAPNHSCL